MMQGELLYQHSNTALKGHDQIKTECMYVRTKNFFRKGSEPELKNTCCHSVNETKPLVAPRKGPGT